MEVYVKTLHVWLIKLKKSLDKNRGRLTQHSRDNSADSGMSTVLQVELYHLLVMGIVVR